jgi:hypothetical protein
MRWLQVALAVLSSMAMTGCPSEFGKDGRVNKAVRNDTRENLLELTGCSEAWRAEVCGDGPNRNRNACKKCGGP